MLKVTKTTDGQPLLLSTKEIDKIYKVAGEATVVNYGKGQSITVSETLVAIQNSTGPRDCILVTYKDSPTTQGLFFFHNIKSIERAGTGSRVLFNATVPIEVMESVTSLAAQIAATVPSGTQDADFYRVGTTQPPANIANPVWRTGSVAIGLATPLKKLHVNGNTRSEYVDVDGYNYLSDFGNQSEYIQAGTQIDAIADTLYLDIDNFFSEIIYNTDGTNQGGTGGFAPAKVTNTAYNTMSGGVSANAVFSALSNFVNIGGPASTSTFEQTNAIISSGVSDFITGNASSAIVGTTASIISSSGFFGQGSISATPSTVGMVYQDASVIFQGAFLINSTTLYNYARNNVLGIYTETVQTENNARFGYAEDITSIENKVQMNATQSEIYSQNNLLEKAAVRTKQNVGAGLPGTQIDLVPEYLDNATALLANLEVNTVYRTGDFLKIVH